MSTGDVLARDVVSLNVADPDAQDLLWAYAERRRGADTGFADALERALIAAGHRHEPRAEDLEIDFGAVDKIMVTFPEDELRDLIDTLKDKVPQAEHGIEVKFGKNSHVKVHMTQAQLRTLVGSLDYRRRRMQLKEVP